MIVIKKDRYGGIDWHDSHSTFEYIKPSENNFGYASIEDAKKAIIEDIVKEFPDEEEKIREAFVSGKDVTFPIKINKYDEKGNIIGFDYGDTDVYEGQTYYEASVTIIPSKWECIEEYMFGQIDYHIYYTIQELENPTYAVIENFLAITKGVPNVERIYHRPFESYAEAKAYLDSFKPHEEWNVQMYIACWDINKINKEWYDLQLKVIDILDTNPELLYDNSFSPYVKQHYENLTNR